MHTGKSATVYRNKTSIFNYPNGNALLFCCNLHYIYVNLHYITALNYQSVFLKGFITFDSSLKQCQCQTE